MSQPYLGEIRLFGGNFAPRNNAYCSGQLMNIAQNAALFSLLGTTYGGNGVQTFALPDLRSRLPVSMGQGPGLSNYTIGEAIGTESVTITLSTLPLHSHSPVATTTAANSPTPGGTLPAALAAPFTKFWINDADKTGSPVAFSSAAVGNTGGNLSHENRMPAMAISIIIALSGIFPSRN